MMRDITKAADCVHKPLLCWVDYPPHGKNCYAYPRYAADNGSICSIAESVFPDEGGMTVYLTGGYTPEDAKSKNGDLVVMTINTDEMPLDDYYGKKRSGSHKYRGALNLSFQRGHSEIDFEKFSSNSMSGSLAQIVRVAERDDFSVPTSEPLTLSDDIELFTSLIMIASADGSFLSGPFNYDVHDSTSIVLKASGDFDSRVARAPKSQLEFCSISNKFGEEVVSFVTWASVSKYHGQHEADLYDWISHSELVEAANRAITSAREAVGLSKTQMRTLKNAIRKCSEDTARLKLDDARKARLEEVLESFEFWQGAPEAMDRIASSLTSQQLADIILDEDNYDRFEQAVLDNTSIKDEIEARRSKLEEGLAELQSQVDSKQRELEETTREVENAQTRRRELQDEALDNKREEVTRIEARIKQLKEEQDEIESRTNWLRDRQMTAQRSFDAVFRRINNEEHISEQILESEVVRQVVAAVSGNETTEDGAAGDGAQVVIDSSYIDMTSEEVVKSLYERITEKTGRSYSPNDVVNFLVCMTQGYITTFAGKPGTGKTSLCAILAGALGLRYEGQRSRFAELSVEKGWATYKDYIGYYNPLTKRYEKTIPLAYDSMKQLDRESAIDGEHAPFVMLLDEANLSPIEHYWAPFLHACDTFQNGTVLTLGGSDSLTIPAWTRFLATVNFDHTTETLSPRFLDRSWVITLDPDDIDFDPSYQNPDFSSYEPISYSKLMEVFGGDANYTPDQASLKALNQILRVCKDGNCPVSPRSQGMIMRYLSAATNLMDKSSKDSTLAPLDYAVSQKILPMLSGPADQLKTLFEGLTECCSTLTITSRKLKQMREAGEANGFYQYFV